MPRRARLVATAAVTVGLTLSAAPVLAHDTHDHRSTGAEGKSSAGDLCTDAREDRLEAAGDNFAQACLPGQDLAQTKGFESDLAACRARMDEKPFRFGGDPRLVFLDCMEKRGWHLKGRS